MPKYWVVGGEYTDTSFQALAPGASEERLGPYETYQDALKVWSEQAFRTVDNANARYRVVVEEAA